MLFAKLRNIVNKELCSTIRGRNQKGFHLSLIRFAQVGGSQSVTRCRRDFMAMPRFTSFRGTDFGTGFSTDGMPKIGLTDSLFGFLADTFTKIGLTCFCDCFRTWFLPKMSNAHFLTGFIRVDHTKMAGLSITGNIVSLLWVIGAQFLKPVAFALKQERGQDQFNNRKVERIGAVLVPRSLQKLVVVVVAKKFIPMLPPTVVDIHRAAQVQLLVNGVGNRVDATDGFKRGHIPNSLVASSLVLWWLSGKQGTSFTDRVITPSLDNRYKYTFFSAQRKAEPLEVA